MRRLAVLLFFMSVLNACSLIEEEACDVLSGTPEIDQEQLIPYLSPVEIALVGDFYFGNCGGVEYKYEWPSSTIDHRTARNDFESGVSFFEPGAYTITASADGESLSYTNEAYNFVENNVWGDLPNARDFGPNPVALNIQGRLFAGMNYNNEWYELNPSNYQWEERSGLGFIDFEGYGGFMYQDEGHIIGSNGFVYKYNLGSDSWSEAFEMINPDTGEHLDLKSVFDYNESGAYANYTMVHGDKLYFMGGQDQLFISYNFLSQEWAWEKSVTASDVLIPTSFSKQFKSGNKFFIEKVYYDFDREDWFRHDFDILESSITSALIDGEYHFYLVNDEIKKIDANTLTISESDIQPAYYGLRTNMQASHVTWNGLECQIGQYTKFYKK